MSRMISLDGVTNALDSLKAQVKPLDVGVGYVGGRFVGGFAAAKLDAYLAEKYKAEPSKRPEWSSIGNLAIASQVVAGFAAYVLEKGNARAKGHFVGAVGGAAVDFVMMKLNQWMAASKAKQLAADGGSNAGQSGYVTYDGMGILTQDNSFGILTQDNSFGGITYEVPTEAELSGFGDYSNKYMNDAVEEGY